MDTNARPVLLDYVWRDEVPRCSYADCGARKEEGRQMTEIEVKCPRCGGKAIYYHFSRSIGCVRCGWLLYTETPPEVRIQQPTKKTSAKKDTQHLS
jgi:ribosomal protein S27E